MAKSQASTAKLWTREYKIILLINFCLIGAFYLIAPILPLFATQIDAKDQSNLAIGVFIIPTLIFRPISGFLCDRYGYKVIGLVSIGLMVVSFIGYVMVSNGNQLVLCRLVHGVAYGMALPPIDSYCTRIIPKKRRSEGKGYFGFASNLGMTVFTSGSLHFASKGYIRSVLFAGVILTTVAFILLTTVRRAEVVLNQDCKSKQNMGRNSESEQIVANMSWFKVVKVISPFAAIMCCVTIYNAAVTTYIQPYTIEMGYVGLDSLFMLVNNTVILLSRLVLGRLIDRLGRNIFVAISFGCFLVGIICLGFGEGLSYFYIAAVANALGLSCLANCVYTHAVEFIPTARLGLASGIYYTIYDFGACLSALGGELLGDRYGYQIMFQMLSVSLAVAVVFAIFTMRKVPPKVDVIVSTSQPYAKV
jgi:MFS family permease